MRVERDQTFARVVEWNDPAERTWLSRVLTYGRKSRGPFSTGQTRAFDDMNEQFLAGLLPDVVATARTDGVQVLVRDLRGPPPVATDDADTGWLDAHQQAAVGAVLTYLRGIVKMPTGGGKTEVFIALALRFAQARVGFFAPREQLAQQAAERWALRTDGAPCGYFLKGKRDLSKRVVFATFQSVVAALEAGDPDVVRWLESLAVFAADECQTCAAATFLPVLTRCTNARVRVGFSATPLDRSDDRAVHTLGALGPVIHEVTPAELVASGRIVPAEVRMLRIGPQPWVAPRHVDPSKPCPGCGQSGTDPCDPACWTLHSAERFDAVYRDLIVHGAARNAALVQAVVGAPKPALMFVTKREHATVLRDLLHRALACPVPVVDGNTPQGQRVSIAQRLNDGVWPVVVAGSVWEAGVDIPALRTVVNAGGGKAVIRTVQVLGRGVRADASSGKLSCGLIDVFDEGDPTLSKHAAKRLKTYRAEGWQVDQGGAATPAARIPRTPLDFFDDPPSTP